MADDIQTKDRSGSPIAIAAKDTGYNLLPRNLLQDTAGNDIDPARADRQPLLQLQRVVMLAGATATGPGAAKADLGRAPSFDCSVSGTGAVSATVLIECRNTASGVWATWGAITLSGTNAVADVLGGGPRFVEYRANVTAISGTGATINCTMGS